MAFYVVSERNACRHVAWGTSYEFEDIIARTCDAEILAPYQLSFHRKLDMALSKICTGRYYKLKNFEFADEPNVLLLVGMGPETLKMLNKISKWRKKCDVVAAYIVDLYPVSYGKLDVKLANQLDHLFLSYEQIIEPMSRRVSCPISLIYQAADAWGQGAFGGNRTIDITGYGRQKAGIHQLLQNSFNLHGSDKVYFHSTFAYHYVKNWKEDRQLFWKIMAMSKLSLCYRYEDTNMQFYRGVSPITARWFEAIAAGCGIVGSRPSGPEGMHQFDWEDAIIDLPENNDEVVNFLVDLLNQEDRLEKISKRNYYYAITRHDWRLRLKQMLGHMGLDIPVKLQGELDAMNKKSEEMFKEMDTK